MSLTPGKTRSSNQFEREIGVFLRERGWIYNRAGDAAMLFQERELKLRALASELRQIKPEGWSIVFGKDAVVARPKDRSIGKFCIYLREEIFTVAFFSRELNIWNKWKVFSEGPNVASSITNWMLEAMADPRKREGD